MSVRMSEIADALEALAPMELAEDWDNVGLLIGDSDADIKRLLVALDVTDSVIAEAEQLNADCIITHHPVIFKKLSRITADTPNGRRLLRLIRGNIAVYSAHTNLDIAEGGTNDTLSALLGIKNIESLVLENSLGRVGDLEKPITLKALAEAVKQLLGLQYIGYSGNPYAVIKRVGIMTGSGGESEYIKAVVDKGCDVYITSDIKYHYAQEALDMGLSLIDATHYASEVLIVNVLCKYLQEKFNSLIIIPSKVDGQIIHYV